ncbi:VWA domain-containing protein [Puniceicoccales bacterium CK1056]|uniref:VWA domain-containing protein n=1 Tax=Oceanipulchritudo coccoides TaxID=2706888 RepID=A0A6B2M0M7_9BACT|nr:VWA domain-containing protein [Oceanipulchritudo coccoides]NDV61300.1 VWA domain-containing protein [Oceanipulchritudo coccoides]
MMPQFAEPIWLLAGMAAVLVLFLLFLLSERRAWRRLREFAAPSLLEPLTASHSRTRLWVKNGLLLLCILLLCFSLARPQWGANWEKAETRGIDVMIALDTSRSMMAEDIKPNRLERSKLAILDLLETVKGDRVGLIAFAGNAFLQCPLTLDYQAFRQTLFSISTETIPVGGTDVATAIDEAEAYFEETGNERILILITDGEDLEASGIQKARDAGQNGTRILAVGVGSTSGELIPISTPGGQQDFLRDASGKPVSTALDEGTLRRIAEVSNGLYAPLGPTGEGLRRVYEFSLAQSESTEQEEMLQRIPIERFQWPLAGAIFVIILESLLSTRRRNKGNGQGPGLGLAVLFLGSLVVAPGESVAGTAKDAEKAYQDGRYEESLTLYKDALLDEPDEPKLIYNTGVSAYRSGEYEEAITRFEQTLKEGSPKLQTKAFYNTGNSRVAYGFDQLEDQPALARDQWQFALKDYESALALDPGHSASQQNIEALRETIANHTYSLDVQAEPADAGSVSPGGEVFHKVPVPLEAKANEGWLFTEWTGEDIEDSTKARTTIRPTENRSVIARFVKTWQLEVATEDPSMGSAGESGTYREDEPVTIKAEGEDYFAFSKWIPEGCEVANEAAPETEVTLTADAKVTATFVPAFKLSVNLDPEIGGKAGPSGFFEEYSVVPIKAEPRPGFEWVGWVGDGIKDPNAPESSISLTADRIAIAEMKRIWNLVIIPTPEEGGTVEGAGNHPIGSTVEISATPAEGFKFDGWEGPGVEDPEAPSTRVTVQSTEHNLFARFSQDDSDQDQEDQDQQDQEQEDQQDQQQDQQDQQDQQEEDSQSDQQEEQDNEDQQEDTGEPEDNEGEEQEEQPSEQESPGEPQQEDSGEPVPMEMSREEARQLLNALSEDERFLPASELSQEKESDQSQPSGRDW